MFKAEYLFYIIIEMLFMDNFPLDLQDHIEIYDDYLETIDYNFNRYEKKTLDKFLDEYSEYPMRVYGGSVEDGIRTLYPFSHEIDFSAFDIRDEKYYSKLFFGIMYITEEFNLKNYDIGLLVNHPDKWVYLKSNVMKKESIDNIRMITKYYDLFRKINWS